SVRVDRITTARNPAMTPSTRRAIRRMPAVDETMDESGLTVWIIDFFSELPSHRSVGTSARISTLRYASRTSLHTLPTCTGRIGVHCEEGRPARDRRPHCPHYQRPHHT